jgi:threonine dehydrogenase-like Zn-dependent dehydrogenase
MACNALRQDIVRDILEREPLGMDVVFECCGQQDAFDQALDLLRPGGKLILVGIPEFDSWTVNAEKIRRKEISIHPIRRQVDSVQASLDLMESGEINVGSMVTHRFPFSKTKQGFDLVAAYGDGVMKAMIEF